MAAQIKNYTSSVPADTSIARIEKRLIQAGAMEIRKELDPSSKEIRAIFFTLPVKGVVIPFRLPANVNATYKKLSSKRSRISASTTANDLAQARRTSWKTVHDWVEAQMALIEMEQAEAAEIFLPYAWNGSETLWQRFAEGRGQLLLGNE